MGPDATQIAIGYFSVSALNLHLLNLDGTGDKERIIESELFQWPTSWSADGHLLAYVERHPQTGLDLWVLPLDGERRLRSFLATSFDEDQAVFSPDGRWLAYSSNETGRVEVFLRSLAGSEKEQVSIGGGSEPAWAKSGRELFYRKGHAMMAVSVRLEPTLDVGNPQKLFDRDFPRADTFGSNYDVAADGRFLILEPVEPFEAAEVNLVVNWFEELRRLAPKN